MRNIFLSVFLLTCATSNAQNVGIGTTLPTDKLHINSAVGEDPLRVQVNSTTKLRVWANGGTAIGTLATPPVNGLLVQGTLQPQNNIATANKMIIESTADSMIINAGGSQLIIAANGNITIRSAANTKIDIDAGGSLNLSGNTITIQATASLNLNGTVIKFNGGSNPVARKGDAVSVPSGAINGTITSGNPAILSN